MGADNEIDGPRVGVWLSLTEAARASVDEGEWTNVEAGAGRGGCFLTFLFCVFIVLRSSF